MACIAIIPARGGSKRVPRKNVRNIGGKPVIAYPIQLALQSGIFERVIVSTEDKEIAELARYFGAEVPFLRDVSLSDDSTTTLEVIADSALRLNLSNSDLLCCIYPVTPLLTTERLLQAYGLLQSGHWDYVFSASEFVSPIQRAFRRDVLGAVSFLQPEYFAVRTQDLEKSFCDAGQFYFGKAEAWKNKSPIFGHKSTFLEFSRHEVIDVDDERDWMFLEQILEIKKLQVNE